MKRTGYDRCGEYEYYDIKDYDTCWSCKYFVDNKFETRFECEKEVRDEDCYERNDEYDEY